VSGNVSLYNETDGSGILPTPTIGAVGLIKDSKNTIGFDVRAGHVALVLGEAHGHLGQSALLAEAFGRADGDAPAVDLEAEAAHGDFIRAQHSTIAACCDLSDGGLALAAFEMADHAGLGLALETDSTAHLFGEDQARYLMAVAPDNVDALRQAAEKQGLVLSHVGVFGGDDLAFGEASAPLRDLSALYASSFALTVT